MHVGELHTSLKVLYIHTILNIPIYFSDFSSSFQFIGLILEINLSNVKEKLYSYINIIHTIFQFYPSIKKRLYNLEQKIIVYNNLME